MRNLFLTLVLLMGLATKAQETPPSATITSIDYRGSGCDANSANVVMTPDLNYMSVLYDRFNVEIGAGTANPNAKAQEKNCVIVVKMILPPTWSFQFEEVEYRGFVAVPNQMTMAYQLISVETTGTRGRNFEQNMIRGPKMENFVTIYKNPVADTENATTPMSQLREAFGGFPGRGGPPGFGGHFGPGFGRGPGDGRGPGGPGGPGGRRRHQRRDDLFDCSDKPQQAVLRIRSRIGVRNMLADKTNPLVKIVVDSTDASFNQKLKISWNKCAD